MLNPRTVMILLEVKNGTSYARQSILINAAAGIYHRYDAAGALSPQHFTLA